MSDYEPWEDWTFAWDEWAESKEAAQRLAAPKAPGQIDVTVMIGSLNVGTEQDPPQ
jgi:hypothetical protein